MDFPKPKLKTLTNEQLVVVDKFDAHIKELFQKILTSKKQEEEHGIKTKGFRRSFEPSYRVSFSTEQEISQTKSDTLAHILRIKTEDSNRPLSTSHNKDILKPGEKRDIYMTSKKTVNELEDDGVEVIDRNRLQSFKKQKTSTNLGKVPESVSQYSFSSKYNKPLSSLQNKMSGHSDGPFSEKEKYNISGSQDYLHDLKKKKETTKKTLDFIEQEYIHKKELMKKQKEEERIKQEKDKDKQFVEKVLSGDGNSRKSRFEGSSYHNKKHYKEKDK